MTLLLFSVIIALSEIILGLLVITRKPNSVTHRTLFTLTVLIAVWSICIGVIISPLLLSIPLMRLLVNGMFFSSILISTAVLYFSWVFPNDKVALNRMRKTWLVSPGLIVGILLFGTNWFVVDVFPGKGLVGQIEFNPFGYAAFTALFIMNMFWAAITLIQKYRAVSGVYQKQIRYLGLGLIIPAVMAVITHAILPMRGATQYLWAAPFYPLIFIIIAVYTIIRYRLLDIDILLKKTTLYLTLVGVITAVYVFVMMLPQGLLGTQTSPTSVLLMLLSAAVIAFTIQPLRDWLDNATDRIFFQKRYNYHQVLERLARELSTLIKVEDILRTVADTLLDALHLDKVGIYLHGQVGRSDFVCLEKKGASAGDLPLGLDDEDALVTYLQRNRKLLMTGEFLHYQGHLFEPGRVIDSNKAEVYQTLSVKMKIELVVPLWLKHSLIGFLALGNKRSGDQYTDRDLSLLETISSQMAVVLENAKLYEQMLNSERLRVLGAMSASIAHEIRNPLAAIKTFIQMLPNKYEQGEFRQRFNEIVPVEIERLTRITGDLLTFARPSPPSLMPTEINALLDRVVTLLGNQVRKKQVTILTEYGVMDPIQADGQQLTQVFMNLVLNAVQASAENGRVWLTTVIKGRPGEPEGLQQVVVEVRDEGCGIKPKDMPNIFEPFFTTKHEGTGLGLATSRRIIESHYGQIFVTSEEGRGTTFTVNLPILQPGVESAETIG